MKLTLLKQYIRCQRTIAVRTFSSSQIKDDMFEALEEEAEKDVGFDEWVKSTKATLESTKGRYWLGKNGPFPHNPAFVPRPVLSNISKTKIFELFKLDPKANNHRSLSSQFKVSIERIGSIIRQKELELELAQKGFNVDSSYVKEMESNLECVNVADDPRNSEKTTLLPSRPIFACVPEGRTFDFEDAKAVLIANGLHPKILSKEKIKSDSSLVDAQVTEISRSEFERSRSNFVFVDTSKKDEVHIVVRDTEGALRTPTKDELKAAIMKTWNRNAPSKIIQ